jgi:hypothetical protein
MKRQPDGREYHGGLKIAVRFERETFKRIRKRAEKENKSFSAMVEDTVKCGLLCLEENDREEQEAA